MLKTRASEPETMTSCSESLGTETYSVSPGWASEGLNVMRLTVRSAFMAPSVFSLWHGRRFGCTAIARRVYTYSFICVFVFKILIYKTFMSGLDPIPEENGAWDYYHKIYYDDDEDFSSPENQNYKYTTPMAEDGYDPMDTSTEKDPLIPDKGDDDDDTDVWDNPDQWQVTEGGLERLPTPGDTDSTQPFEPDAPFTPAGEQVPMSTRTRLPQEYGPRTAETSFITGDTQGQRVRTMQEEMAWREVSGEFPLADTSKLDMRYKVAPRAGGGGGGAIIEVKMSGKDKWYRLYTKTRGASSKSFNDHLPKEIKNAYGKSLVEQFNDTNTLLDRNQKKLAEKQKQLEQVEQGAGEAQKLHRDLDAIRNRIKDDDDRIRELEDAHGSLDTEEIQRLKDEKRGA